jgi:uncharacterized coiled-coil protein SlyX
MKKILFIGTVLLSVSACHPDGESKSDQKSDSLSSVINDRDSSLSNFISSFNEIESNLDSVAAKQKIIALYTDNKKGDIKGNKKAHINAEIAAINNLMDKNRKEMEELSKKLKGSKTKNALLEKTIKTLTVQISQKDYELCELNIEMNSLNVKVAKLSIDVDSLTEQNYIKSVIIDYQAADLHTVFYRVGESKDLRDEKIIDQKGGLLGIGRTTTLSENFDNSMFTAIDYTQTTSIPINGSDVTLITNHPSDSYTLVPDNAKKGVIINLVITNPEKFWNTSKYLVISKK